MTDETRKILAYAKETYEDEDLIIDTETPPEQITDSGYWVHARVWIPLYEIEM
jgi:hypothetical protein